MSERGDLTGGGGTSRRAVLGALGGAAAALVVGCEPRPGGTAGGATGEGSGTTDAAATTTDGPTTTGTTSAPVDCDGPATAWAAGGTAAMTAKHCYPDPFAGKPMDCALLCQTTAGPCTADSPDREDISEGLAGLPVRLVLKIVDADSCSPVAGARVDIWHTQRTGVYSGETPMPGFCSNGDAEAPKHGWFRGTRTTDAGGRVAFDTCFPGWYPGRAIHIHVRVSVGADIRVVSQLFFDPALTVEIFAGHPDYVAFGQPNTDNAEDGVIGDVADMSPYTLDTARMPDGAMLASKVVAVRASLAQPNCDA